VKKNERLENKKAVDSVVPSTILQEVKKLIGSEVEAAAK
jgi:hypothetical protein